MVGCAKLEKLISELKDKKKMKKVLEDIINKLNESKHWAEEGVRVYSDEPEIQASYRAKVEEIENSIHIVESSIRKNKLMLTDIMKALAMEGIATSLEYNVSADDFMLDLKTEAKGHLHLYENGMLYGRYNQAKQLNLASDIESLITELCFEFKLAIMGRDYYSKDWAALCAQKGIEL